MRRAWEGLKSAGLLAWLVMKTGAGSIAHHWGLAIISLVAGFAVWVLVQDVENPRTEALVPLQDEQAIPVQAVNVPEGYIMRESPTVRVRVEAREDEIVELRASDFDATVDMLDSPLEEPTFHEVTVTSRRDDVQVLSVEPGEVEVTLVRAQEKQVLVRYVIRGDLPDGYRIQSAEIDPPSVTVSGLPELVDTVATVDIDVNLSGVRDETYETDGPLVARSASGNTVVARLSETRATVRFEIEQIFETRTLPVQPVVTGELPAGYRIVSATANPPTVTVTGTGAVLDSLGDTLSLEAVDVTGARTDIVQTAELSIPESVVADRTSVTVRISIVAQECTGNDPPSPPCGTASFVVGVVFANVPNGLQVAPGNYTTTVLVSATLEVLETLSANDFTATVSLSGATAGEIEAEPNVTGPPDVRIDEVAPVTVELVAAP